MTKTESEPRGEDLPGDYEIPPDLELEALYALRDTETQEEFQQSCPDQAARLEQLERQLA